MRFVFVHQVHSAYKGLNMCQISAKQRLELNVHVSVHHVKLEIKLLITTMNLVQTFKGVSFRSNGIRRLCTHHFITPTSLNGMFIIDYNTQLARISLKYNIKRLSNLTCTAR